MPNNTTNRGYGHAWRTNCAITKRTKPWTCTRCGKPIPRTARWPHPLSWSGGHPTDIATAGTAVPQAQDIRPEHLTCNTAAGARLKARLDRGRHPAPGNGLGTPSQRW